MTPDDVAPPVTIDCRRVGVRPHALVRRLTQATIALPTAAFALMLAYALLYPPSAFAGTWAQVAAGLLLIASLATGAGAFLA